MGNQSVINFFRERDVQIKGWNPLDPRFFMELDSTASFYLFPRLFIPQKPGICELLDTGLENHFTARLSRGFILHGMIYIL